MQNNTPRKKLYIKIIIFLGILGFICVGIFVCIMSLYFLGKEESKTEKNKNEDPGISNYFQISEEMSPIQTENWGEVAAGNVFILLEENSQEDKLKDIVKSMDGEIIGEFPEIGLYQVSANINASGELLDYIKQIKEYTEVETVVPDMMVYKKEIKGKPCTIYGYEDIYDENNNLQVYQRIGLDKAWRYINTSKVKLNNIQVGVVDTGLNTTDISTEINGEVKIEALDKSDVNNKPSRDDKGKIDMGHLNHGTAVTNMIGADWDNGGVVGVAGGLKDKLNIKVANTATSPSSLKQVDIEFMGGSYSSQTISHIQRQIDNGAKIINYSMGFEKPGPQNHGWTNIYRKYAQYIQKKHPDVVLVVVAGNEGNLGVKLDGTNYGFGGLNLDNIITVGSVDKHGNPSYFSNRSDEKDGEITLSAVGSTVPVGFGKDGKVVSVDGTSFSTPQVTGAISILKSINPELKAAEIKKILRETGDTEVYIKNEPGLVSQVDKDIGGRILRIDKAVLRVIQELPEDKRPEITDQWELEELSKVDAYAVKQQRDGNGGQRYDIKAGIDLASVGGTSLQIEMQNENGLIGGESIQKLEEAGTVEWDFGFLNQEEADEILTITRMDTSACTKLFLQQSGMEMDGSAQIPLVGIDTVTARPKIHLNSTIVIESDGSVDIILKGKDNITITEDGQSFPTEFDMHAEVEGTLDEFNNVKAEGTYTMNYIVELPPDIVSMLGIDSYADSTLGEIEIDGNIIGNTFNGTIFIPEDNVKRTINAKV
ncbi:S8 family serine peptidase [Candidatus Dojkabacteria bacterium]|nr:S8 family serine peptidase [Candidatus Dojkabacteria bacterium]